MFYSEGDNIFSEVVPLSEGNKVLVYLEDLGGVYDESCKCFGTHVLEQIMDKEGNIISEAIKKNPHHVELGTLGSPEYDWICLNWMFWRIIFKTLTQVII